MTMLYCLTFYTWPYGDYREGFDIGLFRTREEVAAVEKHYLKDVAGFKDYYCESEITEVPVIGDGSECSKVYRYTGWNVNEDLDEVDTLSSDCYISQERAQTDYENAQQATPRQEWNLSCWTIGECEWEEGFVRTDADDREAMTLHDVQVTLKQAAEQKQNCRIDFHYEDHSRYFFPLEVNDYFFMSREEIDFELDGFTIRRLRDVADMDVVSDKYMEIAEKEGLLDQLNTPNVDISSWESIFASLQSIGKNIIIEEEHIDDDEMFAIGRIENVLEDMIQLKYFDADGVWEEELWDISYSDITSVTFGSRYVEVFSKYLHNSNPML